MDDGVGVTVGVPVPKGVGEPVGVPDGVGEGTAVLVGVGANLQEGHVVEKD